MVEAVSVVVFTGIAMELTKGQKDILLDLERGIF